MTVREGWPPFEVWQQRRFILPRGRRILRTFGGMASAFEGLGASAAQASESINRFSDAWVTPPKPKYGRGHRFGFHNKCSPIICEKAAKLCNEAESELRMKEYLEEQRFKTNRDRLYQEHWEVRNPNYGQEFWDG